MLRQFTTEDVRSFREHDVLANCDFFSLNPSLNSNSLPRSSGDIQAFKGQERWRVPGNAA